MLKNTEVNYRQLFNENRKYKNDIENISDIMVTYTAEDGSFIGAPKKLITLLEYKEDELLNTNIWNVTVKDDADKERVLHQELISGLRKSYNLEKRVSTKSGAIKWLYKDAFLVDKDDGSLKYIFNYILDITERKRMEEELRLINYKYKKLLELLPDTVTIVKDGIITFINNAGVKAFGYSYPDEIIGKEASEFLTSDEFNYIKELSKRSENNLGVVGKPYEMKIIRNDGQLIDMEAVNVGFIDDKLLSVMAVLRDITERRKNELLREEIIKNAIKLEEAKVADKTKNEFLANISHELRTPLNVIMGTLQLLALYEDHDFHGGCHINKYIKIMRQNCYRLLRLINNLIDISKIDAGFFKMSPKKCDIVKTVEDITLSIVEYIESKGLSLVFDTDVEEKVICCDLDQIERIVLNLLANSIKFTEPGGCISVNIETEEDSIRIIVKDTGIGIPRDQLETIFERFRQVGGGFGGSGIGLSLVKSLVEMHGGDIKVKSEENHGTEFIVTLHVDCNMTPCEGEKLHCPNGNNYESIKIEFSDIYPE